MLTVVAIQREERYDVSLFEAGRSDRKYKGVSLHSLRRILMYCDSVGEFAKLKIISDTEA